MKNHKVIIIPYFQLDLETIHLRSTLRNIAPVQIESRDLLFKVVPKYPIMMICHSQMNYLNKAQTITQPDISHNHKILGAMILTSMRTMKFPLLIKR